MVERNEPKNRYLHADYKKVKDKAVIGKSKPNAPKKRGENVPVNVPVKTSPKDKQKKIIIALSKDSHLSAQKLAEKFGVTDKTIKRDLLLLKKQNLITRIGADKNGY